MAEAFVFVNCESGSQQQVVKELEAISSVSDVKKVFGVYDIVAKVKSDTLQGLKKTVSKIRLQHGIRSTITMTVDEGRSL
ncbi:MAG: Lrp/AsnC ligand binding domain-containing protein [Nitrososphaera sp.]|jgi:DNA-binding Lrp family transcriptional regulator